MRLLEARMRDLLRVDAMEWIRGEGRWARGEGVVEKCGRSPYACCRRKSSIYFVERDMGVCCSREPTPLQHDPGSLWHQRTKGTSAAQEGCMVLENLSSSLASTVLRVGNASGKQFTVKRVPKRSAVLGENRRRENRWVRAWSVRMDRGYGFGGGQTC